MKSKPAALHRIRLEYAAESKEDLCDTLSCIIERIRKDVFAERYGVDHDGPVRGGVYYSLREEEDDGEPTFKKSAALANENPG